jgi:EAL domain-containing protein (putative c-di-GMP-specific phosphodiesterase class I)
VVAALDASLSRAGPNGGEAVALVAEIDVLPRRFEGQGAGSLDRLSEALSDRLARTLGADDLVARHGSSGFAVALAPARGLGVPTAVQLAGVIQRALSEPVSLGASVVHPTVSIGLALPSRLAAPSGETLLSAATLAAAEAQRNGPAGIRTFSVDLQVRADTRGILAREVAEALERGEVRAFFQPQVCARTGALSGFEALARWQHPVRGLIPPVEFLPILEEAGLMRRLGAVMLRDALSALHDWQLLGLNVPRIGVNLSSIELADPHLVERVTWELDRFDISPDRLIVEVLETVAAAREEDTVIRNLAALARLGCGLDLDDFGTGHASITCIRRFSINRIKIDRSFVTGLDRDAEQQRLLGAILMMADRLGLATLAEGVETAEERHALARLGCQHVQGFGIARPMPFEEVAAWIRVWDPQEKSLTGRQLRVI